MHKVSRLRIDCEIYAIRMQAVSDHARSVLSTRKAEILCSRVAGTSFYLGIVLQQTGEIALLPLALYVHICFQRAVGYSGILHTARNGADVRFARQLTTYQL